MQKNNGDSVNFAYSKKIMVSFLFFIFLCFFIQLWFLKYFYNFANDFNVIMSLSRRKNMIEQYPTSSKFILVWNKYNNILKRFGIKNGLVNCSTCNCVFTDKKSLLYDYIRYDGIIFDDTILNSIDRPNRRSKFQLYIFGSQKSPVEGPACKVYNDNFFNVTFTYRINSDVLWSYIAVRNLSGAMVAPEMNVNWEKTTKSVAGEIKSLLSQKRKAAILLVNHDKFDDSSEEYITRLEEHLFHFSLKIDVYAQPPLTRCPSNHFRKTIRDKYYFYMAFEYSFSEDYVTDIVLIGYNNYAVPIVYGGANYSRFLPPGSYINARDYHPYNLAYVMHKAINDPVLFESYFRWTNLYTIEDNSNSLISLCNLCETVHRYKANILRNTSIKYFRRWWNGLNGMKLCLPQAYWNEKANINPNNFFL